MTLPIFPISILQHGAHQRHLRLELFLRLLPLVVLQLSIHTHTSNHIFYRVDPIAQMIQHSFALHLLAIVVVVGIVEMVAHLQVVSRTERVT